MTRPTPAGRKRIDADGVHDLIAGLDAKAYRSDSGFCWIIEAGGNAVRDEIAQALETLGYRRGVHFATLSSMIAVEAAKAER